MPTINLAGQVMHVSRGVRRVLEQDGLEANATDAAQCVIDRGSGVAVLLPDELVLVADGDVMHVPLIDIVALDGRTISTDEGPLPITSWSYPRQRDTFMRAVAAASGKEWTNEPGGEPLVPPKPPPVPITTTQTFPGRDVAAVLGVVSGASVMARNAFSDFGSDLKSVVGGNLGGIERGVERSRAEADERLQQAARQLGADAVIAVQLTMETVSDKAQMVMLMGTAVRFADPG
jgi:uncharacterized protein YbjQ (UPF0145 family)